MPDNADVAHTLLLADDSLTIQRVIELTFAEEDVDVVAVSDGDQAIKRLESAPPDIVLADIGMPGRDGYEVARYIRQTPKLSHIPVVLLTGAFEPVDQAKAAEVGCDGVLAKPFEPQLVIGCVKELLTSGPRSAFKPVDSGFASDLPPDHSAPAAPAPAHNLDDYFDRLDSAFTNLESRAATAPAPVSEQATSPVEPEPPSSLTDQIAAALHDLQPSSDPELPLSYASAAPAIETRAVAEPEHAPMVPAHTPAPQPGVAAAAASPTPSAPRELPSVADAFAAILAAEQANLGAQARPVWPATATAAGQSANIEISDEVIERIVQRVLAQISAGDRVAQVAERLVREEIERIKASIR